MAAALAAAMKAPEFGVKVQAELELHLVGGLRHTAEPRNDGLGGGFDAFHGIFESMPGSFGHLVTAEATGDRPAGAGCLVHLDEDRAAVIQSEFDQLSHPSFPP